MARFGNLKTNNLYIGRSGTLGSKSPVKITATAAEISELTGMWSTVTTTAVDGEDGTATVQFVFKDANGVQMATPVAGEFYISEVATGLTVDAVDGSIAVLTNGVITLTDTGVLKHWNYVTTATGLLGLTIDSNQDSYWVVFKHPSGNLVISGEITITN
jgi:hypothetical protein